MRGTPHRAISVDLRVQRQFQAQRQMVRKPARGQTAVEGTRRPIGIEQTGQRGRGTAVVESWPAGAVATGQRFTSPVERRGDQSPSACHGIYSSRGSAVERHHVKPQYATRAQRRKADSSSAPRSRTERVRRSSLATMRASGPGGGWRSTRRGLPAGQCAAAACRRAVGAATAAWVAARDGSEVDSKPRLRNLYGREGQGHGR